ncbi:MAG: response regulator transcription factor [Bacteroidetes bacterium]|nr:response regulator transcription factor [Bacteroidota bacterium]
MEKRNILIIDDEKSIRFVLENTLKDEFNVMSFSDGIEGLSYLENGNIPDLIISDLSMPQVDGFSFLEKIRNSGFFDNIPVIILSGNDESKDKIKCFEMGADDYVAKPFNPKEIIARVRRRLDARDKLLQRIGI